VREKLHNCNLKITAQNTNISKIYGNVNVTEGIVSIAGQMVYLRDLEYK
jgi:hypothetical protein